MAHTKGPWHLNEHGKIVSSDGRTVPVGGFSLAMYSSPEVIANDNLLSAGPELLEALEAAIECGMVPNSTAKDGGATRHARQVIVADMIRDAVAKAKGLNPDQG